MALMTSRQNGALRTKQERLVARVHATDKALIEQGAQIAGLSVGSFIVAHARKAAEELMSEQDTIRLSAEESRRLVEALLAPPKNSTKEQKAAVGRYREQVLSDVNPDPSAA